jgi:ferredoxin
MAIIITDECINCGACESECPNNAIYEPSENWKLSEGTYLTGVVVLPNGKKLKAEEDQEPIEDDYFYIVSDKCTECKGFFNEPQCAAVCPVDCCVPDENHIESEEELLAKKRFLYNEN